MNPTETNSTSKKSPINEPTGDQLRAIVKSVGSFGSNHGDAPLEYVLAGWRAAIAHASPLRGTGAQIRFERKLTCDAIDGAIAFGLQGINPPPAGEDHWLAPYWEIGRRLAAVPPAGEADAFRERVVGLLLELHANDTLSEGQCAKLLGFDRLSWREIEDNAALGDHAIPRPQDRREAPQAGTGEPASELPPVVLTTTQRDAIDWAIVKAEAGQPPHPYVAEALRALLAACSDGDRASPPDSTGN